MKKIYSSLVLITIAISLCGQAPQAFKYQAVVRDNSGNVLANQDVSFQISILETSALGAVVYDEIHDATTNEFGLVNLHIGNGDVVSGVFADIDWEEGTYFLQVEMDETGSSNYQLMGTSQLLSVPYAFYSNSTGDTSRWRKNNDDLYFNNGIVGIGTQDPEESALLEMNSESKGFLSPRLNTLQIDNIDNPAEGLVVFNTDSKTLNIFDGTNWYSLTKGECVPLPTEADAGPDQLAGNDESVILQGNTPDIGTGAWNIISGTGGILDDPLDPSSSFSGLPLTNYYLTWTILTDCDSSVDTVNISFINNSLAYYVSTSGDDSNPGTITEPFLTISHSLSQAQINGVTVVNIAEGDYTGQGEIDLLPEINLYGGFNSTFLSRDPYIYTSHTGAILGEGISLVTIDGLSIGDFYDQYGSSYSIFLQSCYLVTITNSTIHSSLGYEGPNGVPGYPGMSGNHGETGYEGCEEDDLPCLSCSQPLPGFGGSSPFGVDGGDGGQPGLGSSPGSSGQPGSGTIYYPGGDGGAGGSLDNTASCMSGSKVPGYDANGIPGIDGNDGFGGWGGNSIGYIGMTGYYSISNGNYGDDGQHGTGGGGGGGGMGGTNGCDSYGSSGGGGGAGGEGGDGGHYGTGGGGSYAIFLYESNVTVKNCEIITDGGGDGGDGGEGGYGGEGGLGNRGGLHNSEQDDAGCGGWGGNGGRGGDGGGGGGGGGGPSIGILHYMSTLVQEDNTFQIGTPGFGGWSYDGEPGDDGLTAETYAIFY